MTSASKPSLAATSAEIIPVSLMGHDEPFGSGKRQGGHIGHDHATGECHFICQACNFIEGQARSPEHLEKIAAAIRKARRSSS
ncbi:MAG: hypothetical protein DYH12_20905 [Sorangiineae bacterium PRO1]|nr:hypothetical protein [Sorangiineae bacterium PRO1]